MRWTTGLHTAVAPSLLLARWPGTPSQTVYWEFLPPAQNIFCFQIRPGYVFSSLEIFVSVHYITQRFYLLTLEHLSWNILSDADVLIDRISLVKRSPWLLRVHLPYSVSMCSPSAQEMVITEFFLSLWLMPCATHSFIFYCIVLYFTVMLLISLLYICLALSIFSCSGLVHHPLGTDQNILHCM